MKKISLLYLTLVAATLSSCSGFLTEEPKQSQSTEITLSTFDGLDNAVGGAYAPLNSYNFYGANYVLNGELAAGNARNPVTYPGSGRYRNQTNWSFNESSTSSMWSYCYYIISAVNNVINNLAGKATTDHPQSDLNNLRAESLFLRALCYHDLVTTFALPYTTNPDALGVPVVLVTDNGKPARNTVKEVYARITDDLQVADSLMSPTYARAGFTDAGAGATKLAIEALQSRVYLYMGEWQKSADCATKVINSGKYKLLTGDNYLSMFTANTAAAGGEVIFEMYSTLTNGYWDGSGWEQISYITSPSENGGGSADVCASEDLMKLFSDNDTRLGLYSLKNSKDWFCLKYAGKMGSTAPKPNNTIILRFSEMYLNRAEAIYKGAIITGVTAQSDLDKIAAARGEDSYSPSVTSILNERRKELAFEGHLFYDCKRTQTSVTRTDNGGVNMDGTSKRWALPIPKAEIDANPNCVQNQY